MKRLGIFFFYEKNGDVDDFITYYLADLNKNLTELVVVCNGKLSEQGRAAFSQFTDNIIVRENKGLDVWAYKTALDSYGWAKLSEFDEIVMTNSTLMGPVRPLKEMFDAMWENQDLDFWGLSIHHGAKSNPFKGKHLYNSARTHPVSLHRLPSALCAEPGAAGLLGQHADDRELHRLGAAIRGCVHQAV